MTYTRVGLCDSVIAPYAKPLTSHSAFSSAEGKPANNKTPMGRNVDTSHEYCLFNYCSSMPMPHNIAIVKSASWMLMAGCLFVIHNQTWYVSRDLHARNIKMLGSKTIGCQHFIWSQYSKHITKNFALAKRHFYQKNTVFDVVCYIQSSCHVDNVFLHMYVYV